MINEVIQKNKTSIMGYTALITLMYILNVVYFRKSLDAPLDVILILVFIIFLPGIFTLLSLLRTGCHDQYISKPFMMNVLILSSVYVLTSILFTLLYSFTIRPLYVVDLLLFHLASYPLILLVVMYIIEKNNGYKHIFRLILIGAISVVLYILGTNTFKSIEYRYLVLFINLLFLYIVPVSYLAVFNRKPNTSK